MKKIMSAFSSLLASLVFLSSMSMSCVSAQGNYNEISGVALVYARYKYIVTEYKTVEPSDTWVLNDFGDDRLTVISCTDDGTMRQVVVGILQQ